MTNLEYMENRSRDEFRRDEKIGWPHNINVCHWCDEYPEPTTCKHYGRFCIGGLRVWEKEEYTEVGKIPVGDKRLDDMPDSEFFIYWDKIWQKSINDTKVSKTEMVSEDADIYKKVWEQMSLF